MIDKIFLATGNEHKRREFEEILGMSVKAAKVEIDEIQAVEGEGVVIDKVKKAYQQIGEPVIVDDTGIFLEALGGFPGVLGKWMHKTCGFKVLVDLANLYKNPKAWAKTFIGYHDGKEARVFVGSVEGKIADKPRGESGFGFDPIFIPKGCDKTQAELGSQEKNKISSRRMAIEELKRCLIDKD